MVPNAEARYAKIIVAPSFLPPFLRDTALLRVQILTSINATRANATTTAAIRYSTWDRNAISKFQ